VRSRWKPLPVFVFPEDWSRCLPVLQIKAVLRDKLLVSRSHSCVATFQYPILSFVCAAARQIPPMSQHRPQVRGAPHREKLRSELVAVLAPAPAGLLWQTIGVVYAYTADYDWARARSVRQWLSSDVIAAADAGGRADGDRKSSSSSAVTAAAAADSSVAASSVPSAVSAAAAAAAAASSDERDIAVDAVHMRVYFTTGRGNALRVIDLKTADGEGRAGAVSVSTLIDRSFDSPAARARAGVRWPALSMRCHAIALNAARDALLVAERASIWLLELSTGRAVCITDPPMRRMTEKTDPAHEFKDIRSIAWNLKSGAIHVADGARWVVASSRDSSYRNGLEVPRWLTKELPGSWPIVGMAATMSLPKALIGSAGGTPVFAAVKAPDQPIVKLFSRSDTYSYWNLTIGLPAARGLATVPGPGLLFPSAASLYHIALSYEKQRYSRTRVGGTPLSRGGGAITGVAVMPCGGQCGELDVFVARAGRVAVERLRVPLPDANWDGRLRAMVTAAAAARAATAAAPSQTRASSSVAAVLRPTTVPQAVQRSALSECLLPPLTRIVCEYCTDLNWRASAAVRKWVAPYSADTPQHCAVDLAGRRLLFSGRATLYAVDLLSPTPPTRSRALPGPWSLAVASFARDPRDGALLIASVQRLWRLPQPQPQPQRIPDVAGDLKGGGDDLSAAMASAVQVAGDTVSGRPNACVDGTGLNALIHAPDGMLCDSQGALYFGQQFPYSVIRRATPPELSSALSSSSSSPSSEVKCPPHSYTVTTLVRDVRATALALSLNERVMWAAMEVEQKSGPRPARSLSALDPLTGRVLSSFPLPDCRSRVTAIAFEPVTGAMLLGCGGRVLRADIQDSRRGGSVSVRKCLALSGGTVSTIVAIPHAAVAPVLGEPLTGSGSGSGGGGGDGALAGGCDLFLSVDGWSHQFVRFTVPLQ
jgi:hypothetical protein